MTGPSLHGVELPEPVVVVEVCEECGADGDHAGTVNYGCAATEDCSGCSACDLPCLTCLREGRVR